MAAGAPIPANDILRLEALRSLNLLDTENDASFDRITKACTQVFRVPMSVVSLVDKERQWFKSQQGMSVCETSRDVAFCSHAILSDQVLVVPDALKDERFKNNDLVVGPPHVRFYAGAPLDYEDSQHNHWMLGTLCIVDTAPRELSEEHTILLQMLARLVVAEIHTRDRMEQENKALVAKTQTRAEIAAKSLNEKYIGQVAHDLRTPLNSFSLGLQALLASNLTQEQRDIVSTMEVSAQLMHLTCTKALDHTQLGLGVTMRVNEEMPFSLVRMLEKSEVVVMGYTHESKAVKYEFMLEDDVATHVVSHEDFVWQMYMNLLCNARKFTTTGYIRTCLSIVKSAEDIRGAVITDAVTDDTGRPQLKLAVYDTGVGIRGDQQALLFKPFGQLQECSGGTGLGLYTVYEKARALRGNCGVHSNDPRGSVFWFTIPYVASEAMPKSRRSGSLLRKQLPQTAGNERGAAEGTATSITNIQGTSIRSSETRSLLRPPQPAVTPDSSLDESFPEEEAEEDEDEEEEDEDEEWMRPVQRQWTRSFEDSLTGTSSFRSRNAAPLSSSRGSFRGARRAGHESSVHSMASTASHVHNTSTESVASDTSEVSLGRDCYGSHLLQPSNPRPLQETKEVLIIEDDVATRVLMAHGLKKQGCVVHQAGNGEVGLRMMKERMFHMVLSDIMMPIMDGLECAKRLREWEQQQGDARLPQFICALSANADAAHVAKVKEVGINDFCPKPINICHLMKYLDGKFMMKLPLNSPD